MDNKIFFKSYNVPERFHEWDSGGGSPSHENHGRAEDSIDLNEQLVKNRQSTFFMRVNSGAMTGDGIHRGDVVIVDRSLAARNGKIVIAVLDGEMIIRRLEINNNKKRLLPSTNNLSPIEISESSSFSIWGIVTYVIHSV